MDHTELVTRRPAAALLALAALATVQAALLAGCGGDGSSTGTTSSSNASSGASGAAGGGKTVDVTETEYEISLSTSTFTPGTYTFKISDEGQTTHALEIDGPGVEDRASDTLSAGASTSLTVTLQKGTYELYCPVDGHKDLGMDTKITVS